MKRYLIIPICLAIVLSMSSCDALPKSGETKPDTDSEKTVFKHVTKACDGNDMIYLFIGYKSYSGLSVVANHPDCVGVSVEQKEEK